MKRSNKIIVVLFSGDSLYALEAQGGTDGVKICKTASMDMPQSQNKADIAQFADSFARLLKEHAMNASRLAAIVNSRNVMTFNLKNAAVNTRELMKQAVRLDMERKLEVGVDDISFDFTFTQAGKGSNIYAVLALKKYIDLVHSMAKAAKLAVDCVTIPAAAAGGLPQEPVCDIFVLGDCAQISFCRDGAIVLLKHLTQAGGDDQMASDVCRVVKQNILAEAIEAEKLSCRVFAPAQAVGGIIDSLAAIGVKALPFERPYKFERHQEQYEMAAITAAAILGGRRPVIDLKITKPNKKRKIASSGVLKKIAAAAAVLLILCGAYFYGWRSDTLRIAQIKEQLASMQEQVKTASAMLDNINYTKRWFSTKPVYMEILRELSEVFPEEGTIWLTSLGADQSLNSVITGCANEERVVLDMLDAIKKKPSFKDARIVYIRKTGKSSNVITFAFNFRYSQEN